MKFAHDFNDALSTQGYPPHWVKSAIPYSQLKKVLKRVAGELKDLGLDPETLRQLLNLDPDTDAPLAIKYGLKASDGSKFLRPKLTVLLHLRDGVAVDASLSPSSRKFLSRVAELQSIPSEQAAVLTGSDSGSLPLPDTAADSSEWDASSGSVATGQAAKDFAGISTENPTNGSSDGSTDNDSCFSSSPSDPPGPKFEKIEVPLVCDGEFFDVLQSEVKALDELQAREEKALTQEILVLGRQVAHLTKPSRFSKSDLARWRAVFELYLEAQVFFSTSEQDHGSRDSKSAAKQLQWFQDQLAQRNLARQFKMAESRDAFVCFLQLNSVLLKNVQFQEINRTAVYKILKKFDKRTSLGVSKTFPAQAGSDKLLAGTMAKDMCAQISSELVSQVPQLNDYLCPVCFAIAYRPVRLGCQHVFCIRCIVKIQRRHEKHCPLCRADVVMRASANNLDADLDRYMRKYFRKEVDEKAKANDLERGIEDYGPNYKSQECLVM